MSCSGRPPSMADVAGTVGISHQTMSRIVNSKGRVSLRTRERVQATIKQLRYRPNSVARALVTARSGIISIVTTTLAHLGPSSILVALEVTAREAGPFTSVVALGRFGPDDVASTFDRFSSLATGATMVVAPADSLAKTVASQGTPVPVVTISGGCTFGRGVSVVHADQRRGAHTLAKHLVTLGHRDIACVTDPREWFEARERVAGWREAMVQVGPPMYEPLVGSWEVHWEYVAGQSIVKDDLPDAAIYTNGKVAVGLLRAFVEAGVSVPDDVSVAGSDDVPITAYAGPRLTTVRQDLVDLGRCTLGAIGCMLDGESVDTYVRPTCLVVCDSTGVCPH